MKNYEGVLADIISVESSAASGVRDINWITPTETLGVARDQGGRLEVFLAGEEINPTSAAVRESLEHHDWHRKSGAPLAANRLILPALGHFDQVAAFICAELLRNGAERDVAHALSLTEPIIELAIKRLQLSQNALLGLVGELLLLYALCRQASDHMLNSVVQSWDGWRRSARDFSWQSTGVELKTTLRATSSHMVQGVHQIEASNGEDDEAAEHRLILVSVGLQHAAPGANSISIPTLVQRIIDRMEAAGLQNLVKEFVTRVALYGSESGFGYDHGTMSSDAPFTSNFNITFFRGYDMGDPAIKVLRRDEVAAFHHVEAHSLRFRINLPASISSQNPITGANQVARAILGT